ncbi:hypothetical protein NAC44_14205 [Allorhizobium sp. BGMRC 0089]|uniref:hypothetical protein n=1 Tax=Allorhizobium sonneratiae TaxID=2934936 RepID=UPI002033B430|nr:hypothetical protein [Allorhizobium sonneratiae]MCM2293478.1 hypothetical protein [Allorhizobium sonneratiae]
MAVFRSRRANAEPDIDLLPPERPAARTRPALHLSADFEDARFVTLKNPVEDIRSRIETGWHGKSVTKPPALVWHHRLSNMMTAAERQLRRMPRRFFLSWLAVACLVVFLLSGGAGLFLSPPPAAVAINPLAFTHVTLTRQQAAGMPVLRINAIILNQTDRYEPLKPIRAELYDDGHLISTTVIAAPALGLGPGESRGFSARLRHPGGKIPELKLSFGKETAQAARM